MCSHHTIVNKLRTLLAELKARESYEERKNIGSGNVVSQIEVERRPTEDLEDHRKWCASIDGCDTTR